MTLYILETRMSIVIILGTIIVVLLIVFGAGTAYQLVGGVRDRRRYPLDGKLVDVGGYRMHIICAGEGLPTVVMDTGLGHTSPVWSLVAPEVSTFTRVVTYDRAGYGWSERGPAPHSSQQIALELHTLLHNANIAPPYVLVGHSFGGLNMYTYTTQYPGEVAGLVLVDAVPPMIQTHNPVELRQFASFNRVKFRALALATRRGITRAYLRIRGSDAAFDFVSKLPTVQQPSVLAGMLRKTFQSAAAESQMMEQSVAFANAAPFPSTVPLIVLSHGIPDMFTRSMQPADARLAEQSWQQMQAELAACSTRGTLIIAPQAGHKIHIDQPQLVIDVIRQLVTEVRNM